MKYIYSNSSNTQIWDDFMWFIQIELLQAICTYNINNEFHRQPKSIRKNSFPIYTSCKKCNIISCWCGDGKDMKTPKGTNFIASWGSLTCLLTNSWCMCPCLNKYRYGGFLYPVWSNANFGKHYVYLLDFFSRSDILTWRLNCYTT